jgi:hypothetical protein
VDELRGVEDEGFVPDAPADVALHLSSTSETGRQLLKTSEDKREE